jgi:hypothetical protein
MTKRYTGGVVSSSLPTVNAAGASGVFNLSQQSDYQSRNAWPPYKIEESLRFRSSANAYLNRTPTVASNRKTWTWSGWVKRGNFANGVLLGTETVLAQEYSTIYFVSDKIYLDAAASNIETMRVYTDAVFRDPSAWYHVVAVFDSTQATATNRRAIYVNGVLQTLTVSTNPAQNLEPLINSTVAHNIGRTPLNEIYFDGYMSEVYFIDGQALTPASFGATDKDGNWSPIAYTGAYGTNGFYLNFSNNTSATTMGLDSSGNGNNWTLNGFNVSTANTSYDIMIDVPEDQAGANNRGNYCTWNPAFERGNESITDGMLNGTTGTTGGVIGTIAVTTGKWYWETVNPTTTSLARIAGLINFSTFDRNMYTNSIYALRDGRYIINNGSEVTYGSAAAIGDIIGVALDVDAQTVIFYLNGVAQGSAISLTSVYSVGQTVVPAITQSGGASRSFVVNFGQRPWAYAPPAGYKALCTTNLSEPTIKQPNKHFDATLYTGTGSNTTITNAGSMEPGLVWIKSRSTAAWHILQDSLRGSGIIQFSNRSDYADQNKKGTQEVQFNSNGFNLIGPSPGVNDINESGATFVAWQWKSASSNTTNTTGSITTQVRANPTAGFSTFTFSGSASNGTIGHGLGAVPSMFIIKRRTNYSTTYDWYTYHKSIGNTKFLRLNTSGGPTTFNLWQNTDPTSSVIYLTNDDGTNQSGQDYLGYAWAEIPGYSAFGRYTGNGSSNGPFAHTGFRPKFIMIKRTGTESWELFDTSRSSFNQAVALLEADSASAENTSSTSAIDILSNGFKQRNTRAATNSTGVDYIYAAFAEMPFKYARAR